MPKKEKQLRVDDMMVKKPWKNKIIPKKEPKKPLVIDQTVLNRFYKKKLKVTKDNV